MSIDIDNKMKREINIKKTFNEWMEDSTTKLLISLIPSCEHLEAILKDAYISGFKSGETESTINFIKMMFPLSDEKKKI